MSKDTLRVCVVGGGISGLAIAWRLRQEALRTKRPLDLTLIDAGGEPGGNARSTASPDGWTLDHGPGALHLRSSGGGPELLALLRELDLMSELVEASPAASNRYLYVNGTMHKAPGSPGGLVTTSLLTWREKLRLLAEPLSTRAPAEDESVYDFVARHFGAGLASAVAAPLLLGITAGDARTLSMRALFPRVTDLESDSRSLVAAGALRAFRRVRNGKTQSADTWKGAATATLQGGVGRLTAALADRLSDCVHANAQVSDISRSESGWCVTSSSEGNVREDHADVLVLAVPTPVAASLLAEHSPEAASALDAIPMTAVRVTALGYHNDTLTPAQHETLDGFGVLVGPDEGLTMLGCLFTSRVFPDQAPPNHTLLRTISGGVVAPDFVELDTGEALSRTLADLRQVLGLSVEPVFVQSHTVKAAIPQYVLGHAARVETAERAVATLPGLVLAGNGLHGIGMADCVRAANGVVDRVLNAQV